MDFPCEFLFFSVFFLFLFIIEFRFCFFPYFFFYLSFFLSSGLMVAISKSGRRFVSAKISKIRSFRAVSL